ncbi:MAG TPA: GTP 3',8-cyclase MoaA [Chitinophagales bacterium]|nr:GTP 3',8-cyclase MoaA [Chitinophagales bacterium]
MIKDNHGRTISYLRLAVTDRCNLRCFYCMPEEGIEWVSRNEILSFEEMHRLCSLLVKMGIEKIRITGGEPFVRRDVMQLLWSLSELEGLRELTLTTNGVLTAPMVPELKQMGIRSVNLSLDTLDRNRFFAIAKRDELPRVLETLDALLQHNIEVKLNAVVMGDKNVQDIIPLVALTHDHPVSVRFIEEMPFNGGDDIHHASIRWNYKRIMELISENFPSIEKIPDGAFSTSYNYHIPGHRGNVGVIAAYSRTFCGTCNRLRITPQGMLKTCLYDEGVLNVKALLRNGSGDEELRDELLNAIHHREKNGWDAEQKRNEKIPAHESMATIGG